MSPETWTVVASGRTFPVREGLKDWGFEWSAKRGLWIRFHATAGECNLFRHCASSGEWADVELEFVKEGA